ncbi:MAG: AbrB/MazE/SpoVT family DNA-binding domain-containing protein [Erysipelotrichaceae bacterium]
MKSTGIVRRLDDLGRLVIPKEIRKQFRLKEGDSIEFYIDQDKIIIQKFDLLSRYEEEIKIMCETLQSMYQNSVVYIQDDVISSHNLSIRDLFMKRAKVHRMTTFDQEAIYNEQKTLFSGCLYPVIANGDWYGTFIVIFDQRIMKLDELSALEAFTKVLSRQQEQ